MTSTGAGQSRSKIAHLIRVLAVPIVLGWIALGEVLAYSDWGTELTRQVMAGYPGAARPMQAYLP